MLMQHYQERPPIPVPRTPVASEAVQAAGAAEAPAENTATAAAAAAAENWGDQNWGLPQPSNAAATAPSAEPSLSAEPRESSQFLLL